MSTFHKVKNVNNFHNRCSRLAGFWKCSLLVGWLLLLCWFFLNLFREMPFYKILDRNGTTTTKKASYAAIEEGTLNFPVNVYEGCNC